MGRPKLPEHLRKKRIEKVGGPLTNAEIADLRARYQYNPETGWVTLRIHVQVNRPIGTRAGTRKPSGYRRITLMSGGVRRVIYEHRAVFYLMGHPAPDMVDHINGIRDDNRWCNLRATNIVKNSLNRHVSYGANADLPPGVYRRPWKSGKGMSYVGGMTVAGKKHAHYSRSLDAVKEWNAAMRKKLISEL